MLNANISFNKYFVTTNSCCIHVYMSKLHTNFSKVVKKTNQTKVCVVYCIPWFVFAWTQPYNHILNNLTTIAYSTIFLNNETYSSYLQIKNL